MELVLTVEPRTERGRHTHKARAEGYIPGVIYGQGGAATTLQLRDMDLSRILRAGGASHLIQLVGLEKAPVHALVREIQRHPTKRNVLHVDFYRVQMNQPVTVQVPIHLKGESPAAKGGVIVLQNLDHVEIECLPADIPDDITVDLSLMQDIDDVIRVENLIVPERVALMADPHEVVVRLEAPRVSEEEVTPALEGPAEPELIRREREAE